MKKVFLGVYNPSIILTYLGTFFSLAGIIQMLTNDVTCSADSAAFAMIFLVLAGVCDLFDGTIARMCKRTEQEKQFGIQLDSLADTVSFVALPAIAIIQFSGNSWHSYAIACFYLFAGIMRLGWFNVTAEDNKGYFFGLPVTSASLVFPLTYAIVSVFNFNVMIGYVFEAVGLLVGILFILNVRLKKPKIVAAIAWIVLSISIVSMILFI